jgi:hypothetical protein
MVHGLLVDEGGEFFVQRAYALPDARPDGAPWSREDVTYHEWHAAFGVGAALVNPAAAAGDANAWAGPSGARGVPSQAPS